MSITKISILRLLTASCCVAGLAACGSPTTEKLSADYLLSSTQVYTGDNDRAQALDIAICLQRICGVYPKGQGIKLVEAKQQLDFGDKLISPGFIDPHTHSLEELLSTDDNHNLNYLTQGVTTVINGNDGGGPVDFTATEKQLIANGIGTNVGLFVGHGPLREQVMGRDNRQATAKEIAAMSELLAEAMQQGALGFSSGLYYVPQSFANTEEVIALAKVAAGFNGIYDTHLRDESTFNIGFLSAIQEAIDVAQAADIHLHIAHIKALGVDVWGQSEAAIALVNQAQQAGVSISADQYPWLASGTMLRSAVVPKWVMAGDQLSFFNRLNDEQLRSKIRVEITENIRRRGGSESLLITDYHDQTFVGLNLAEVAQKLNQDVVNTVIYLVQQGQVRVASFNMNSGDVERFMQQPWVVTSSDGTNGHPRKYASFPKKFARYVKQQPLLTVGEFIRKSSAQTADILGLFDRGRIKQDHAADIIVLDSDTFAPNADFSTWNVLSSGVETVFVNGTLVIDDGQYLQQLAGQVVHRSK